MVELLERERFLQELEDYAADAGSGSGRLVVVTGEAGIGKTALVETFRAGRPDVRWLWGACDGGFTPRPLGPLYDIAAAAGGRLREMISQVTDRNELFAAFLELLAEPTPTGVVIEDLHWADEATLDLLSHVSRRLGSLPVLLLVTYRDDEPGDDGLLADVMGRISSHPTTRRLALPRLSTEALRRLAPAEDVTHLHALTGGNPFFVGEVLAMDEAEVPPSVADLVRARVRRHSPPAQRILAGAAVLGRPAPASMLAAVTGTEAAAVDECSASGTLVASGHEFAFRHELTRRAVEDGVPRVQAAELHRIALLALEREGADDAELAHHAVGCGDVEATLKYAVRAGHTAAAASAHREAAVQLRRALEHCAALSPADHADIREALAESLSTRDLWIEAEEHWARVVEIRRSLADPVALSRCLRRYGACLWRLCRTDQSRAAEAESFALMRNHDDTLERGLAFYIRVVTDAAPREERLIALDECFRIGKDLGDESLVGRAHLAKAFLDGSAGVVSYPALEEALACGLAAGDSNLAACAYTNLYECSIDMLDLTSYVDRYEEGLAYCLDHEEHTYSVCMRGARVTELVRRGRNDEAISLALATMEETISPLNRMHLGLGLTQAAFRSGRPEARSWLEETWELGLSNDEAFWLLQIATAAAEGAWLSADPTLVDARVHQAYERGRTDDPWKRGELACWLSRLGHPVDLDPDLAEPFSLELAGEYASAAQVWSRLGCPFEEAVALAWTEEPEAMRRALEIFTATGAVPAATQLRQALQRHGVRVPAPRGPRAATAAHPAGLTAREAQVLEVLREGLTNAEIARRLFLSPRTVDHHVSSILAKLGVSSRAEAAAAL